MSPLFMQHKHELRTVGAGEASETVMKAESLVYWATCSDPEHGIRKYITLC